MGRGRAELGRGERRAEPGWRRVRAGDGEGGGGVFSPQDAAWSVPRCCRGALHFQPLMWGAGGEQRAAVRSDREPCQGSRILLFTWISRTDPP